MIVVSDASPINILVRVECIEVLHSMFGRVFIPPAVASELSHPRTPDAVRSWLQANPEWLQVRAPREIDPTIEFSDAGEREAISLAIELQADLVLVDDRRARQAAVKRGLVVTGAVGVLEAAARKNLVRLPEVVAKLRQTDFLIASSILDAALQRDATRHREA